MKDTYVLFIDDELNILSSLVRGLMDEEYTCLFVDNGPDALELMETHEISVIVTDIRMPKMNGLQLLKKCKENYPNIVIIVMSDYIYFTQILSEINQGDIFRFIPKPWKLEDELKPAIKEAIEYYQLKIKEKNEQSSAELVKKMKCTKLLPKLRKQDFYISNQNG
ncbi:MAG: response regulator [Bacillota bacterium]